EANLGLRSRPAWISAGRRGRRCGASSFYRFLWIRMMRIRDNAALQHHRLKYILRSVLYPPDSILSKPHHAIASDPVQPGPSDMRGLLVRRQRAHPVPQIMVVLLLIGPEEVPRFIVPCETAAAG